MAIPRRSVTAEDTEAQAASRIRKSTRREMSGSESDSREVVGGSGELLYDGVDSAAVRAHGDRPALLVREVSADHLRLVLGASGTPTCHHIFTAAPRACHSVARTAAKRSR